MGGALSTTAPAYESLKRVSFGEKDDLLRWKAEIDREWILSDLSEILPSPPREWGLHPTGIWIKSPWDAVIGRQLQHLNVWTPLGWNVPLKHAGIVVQLFRDYPKLEADRQAGLQRGLDCLANIPEPTGYSVQSADWNFEVKGCGNVELDRLLDDMFGRGSSYMGQIKIWCVSFQSAPQLASIFLKYPPIPLTPQHEEMSMVTLNDEAVEVLKTAVLPAGYTCRVTTDGIIVKGPFLVGLSAQMRKIKGSWDPNARQWHIEIPRAGELVQVFQTFVPSEDQLAAAKLQLAEIDPPPDHKIDLRNNEIFITLPKHDGLRPALKNIGATGDETRGGCWLLPEHAGALNALYKSLPDLADRAEKILATTPMPEGYTYEVSTTGVFVAGPKSDLLRNQFVKRQGRWNPEARKWSFSLNIAPGLAEDLRAYAGG